VVAHGRLRELLAPLVGIAATAIEFTAGTDGKPVLAGVATGSELHFNLSHSGTLGLIGWSWGREVGVDVEVWRSMRDEGALVRRYFSAHEVAAWEALPPVQRHEAFFNLWTRKEAYVKALGHGLGLPLHSFDVTHENGAGARLLRLSALAGDARPWSLAAPTAAPGASLAVVLQAETLIVSPAG
jgi:4'-phosphopantetheinyl transferase